MSAGKPLSLQELERGLELSSIPTNGANDSFVSETTSNTSSENKEGDDQSACCSFCGINWFQGIKEDLARRLPHYADDWLGIFHRKTLASILFMFFTSIGPAVTFAQLLTSRTDEHIGVVEVLASSALCGAVFSIIGGQPLVILGVTGPVSIFTISVYTVAQELGVNFLPFYAWCQIWSAIMHMLIAAANLCAAVRVVTRFSCEIFGCLIAFLYLWNGITGIYYSFEDIDTQRECLSSPLLQLLITAGTVWSSLKLAGARSWPFFTSTVRDIIADYGPTLVLVLFSVVPYIGENRDIRPKIENLETPDSFSTTSGRGWFVDIMDIDLYGVFVAIIPGIILTVLFFFDHNVSSLLTQAPEMKLQKGSAYHWDFFVVGLCVLGTGLLGIPPTNGLIPQAPLHARSLAVREEYFDENGVRCERVVKIIEQRMSNLCQALLCGLMCFQPFLGVLTKIPVSVLSGLFIFMGIVSFEGNQFFERMILILSEEKLRDSAHEWFGKVKFSQIIKFTLIQFVCLCIIFIIALQDQSAVVFPMLIAILVPMRLKLFPNHFHEDDLKLLDEITGDPDQQECVADEVLKDQKGVVTIPPNTVFNERVV